MVSLVMPSFALLALLQGGEPSPAPAPSGPPSQSPPAAGAKPTAGSSDELSRQLEEVLSSPQAAKAPTAQRSPSGTGLMNPDVSVIFDGVGGYESAMPAWIAGDDPDLNGIAGHKPAGFTVQELELGFQSIVDPYFAANVFLTIPNLQSLEVEEAYGSTQTLPWNLQLKAGTFRSSAGRQNEQHLHVQDFTLRPLLSPAYLGEDGLRGPGAQLSWLAPTSLFLRFAVEAFSLARGTSFTFGGSTRASPTLVATAKTFVPVTETLSLLGGLTGATGHANTSEASATGDNGPRTFLLGADLYVKWKRPNVVQGYFSLALQTEYFWRRTETGLGIADAQSDGGLYAQLVAQLTRRWHAGVRYDRLGVPVSALQGRLERLSAMAMFTPSEFSKVRLQGTLENSPGRSASYFALLLLEYSMGAHGAHPF